MPGLMAVTAFSSSSSLRASGEVAWIVPVITVLPVSGSVVVATVPTMVRLGSVSAGLTPFFSMVRVPSVTVIA